MLMQTQVQEDDQVMRMSVPVPVTLYEVRADRGDSGSPQWSRFYFSNEDGLNEFQSRNDCLAPQEVEATFEEGEYYLAGVVIRVNVDL